MNEDSEKLENAKTFLELALRTEATIQQASQRLNEKIRSVITLASALVPTVVGLGYFALRETRVYWLIWAVFASLVMFLSAIILGIWLQRPRDYLYVDPKFIAEKYKDKPHSFVMNKMASTWSDTTNQNAEVINDKEDCLKVMYALMVVGLAIIAVSFLLLALGTIRVDP